MPEDEIAQRTDEPQLAAVGDEPCHEATAVFPAHDIHKSLSDSRAHRLDRNRAIAAVGCRDPRDFVGHDVVKNRSVEEMPKIVWFLLQALADLACQEIAVEHFVLEAESLPARVGCSKKRVAGHATPDCLGCVRWQSMAFGQECGEFLHGLEIQAATLLPPHFHGQLRQEQAVLIPAHKRRSGFAQELLVFANYKGVHKPIQQSHVGEQVNAFHQQFGDPRHVERF